MTSLEFPFKFELEEIEIRQIFPDGTIELESSYFYCKDDNTYYFGGASRAPIDCECKLRYGTVFYSTDRDKCKDYLIGKMREMNELADKIHEQMKESKLEIKYLEDEE